jgi:hypothetical protein
MPKNKRIVEKANPDSTRWISVKTRLPEMSRNMEIEGDDGMIYWIESMPTPTLIWNSELNAFEVTLSVYAKEGDIPAWDDVASTAKVKPDFWYELPPIPTHRSGDFIPRQYVIRAHAKMNRLRDEMQRMRQLIIRRKAEMRELRQQVREQTPIPPQVWRA